MSDSASREKLDARKSTLGHLLSSASGNQEVVRCLSLIDPALPDTSIAAVLAKQSRPSVEAVASVMGISDPGQRIFSNREKLAAVIMRRFNQLTPCLCAECNVKYKLSIDSVPSIECHICGRGAHECDRVAGALQQHQEITVSLSHMVWLCYDCYYASGSADIPGTATAASTPARSRNNSISSQNDQTSVAEVLTGAAKSLSDSAVIEEEKTDTPSEKDDKKDSSEVKEEIKEVPDTRQVCKAFLEWGCKHGTRGAKLIMGRPCKDRHPTVCKPFLKFGTSQKGCTDESCVLFHPKLCKFVQTESCCFNSKCKLYHPFGFNKLRKAAVKNRATKLANLKERSKKTDLATKPASTKPPLPEKKEETRRFASYQDFQKFEEVLTRLIGRLDSMEKSVMRLQVHGLPGPPLKPTWLPQSQMQDFSFMNQSAWC